MGYGWPMRCPSGRTVPRLAAAAFGALVLGPLVFSPTAAQAGIEGGRRAALLNLLRQDCGSCHGLALTGGLGPPLTPDTLAMRDETALTDIILNGIPNTPMPAWAPLLAREEATWLVGVVRTGAAREDDAP